MITYPFKAVVDGRVWHPYVVRFESPDGTFECHLYALSFEHACLQLDALKETGRVVARTVGVVG